MEEFSFFIRPFEQADQEQIKRLYRSTVESNPDLYYRPLNGPQLPDDIRSNFSRPIDAFYVAESGGKIIGFCGIRSESDDGSVASLVNGTIAPEFRGRGIYKELFRIREEEAKKKGVKILLAITSHKNIKMRDFLLRDGFEEYVSEKPILGFFHLRKTVR